VSSPERNVRERERKDDIKEIRDKEEKSSGATKATLGGTENQYSCHHHPEKGRRI